MQDDLDDEIANQESNFRYATVIESVRSCANIFDSRDKRDPLCRLNDMQRATCVREHAITERVINRAS